jgi:hypothetical protein
MYIDVSCMFCHALHEWVDEAHVKIMLRVPTRAEMMSLIYGMGLKLSLVVPGLDVVLLLDE